MGYVNRQGSACDLVVSSENSMSCYSCRVEEHLLNSVVVVLLQFPVG